MVNFKRASARILWNENNSEIACEGIRSPSRGFMQDLLQNAQGNSGVDIKVNTFSSTKHTWVGRKL